MAPSSAAKDPRRRSHTRALAGFLKVVAAVVACVVDVAVVVVVVVVAVVGVGLQ